MASSLASLFQHIRPLPSPSTNNHTPQHPPSNQTPLPARLLEVFLATFDLGFTAFGGPPVHFQILYRRFVEGKSTRSRFIPFSKKPPPRTTPSSATTTNQQSSSSDNDPHIHAHLKWIDPQTYQELFAVSQALPGPASTKMLVATAGIHAGWFAAFIVFLLWSLPGAVGMFVLSLGVQQLDDVLPSPVYALLSGLNASTVGIVALAAVQLAEKAVTDKLSRVLVIFGGCAGLCYNALWYFPVLIVIGGVVAGGWDGWLRQKIEKARLRWKKRKENAVERSEEGVPEVSESIEMRPKEASSSQREGLQRRPIVAASASRSSQDPLQEETPSTPEERSPPPTTAQEPATTDTSVYSVPIATGIAIITFTFALLIALLLSRSLIPDPVPRTLALFANMYLAGTVIFGGGPVVIPLLREYVVEPGWVSSRDFLLGLAIIQAFPGPNFNFSVYLGALALQRTGQPGILGAFLAYVGIFFPGLALTAGVQGMWRLLRTKAIVSSVLRGINATAVGLVFTAVYRLWEIGYLTPEASNGQSLAAEPWWVVVASLAYAETCWFGVPPALAILSGAALGLAWYGVVSA